MEKTKKLAHLNSIIKDDKKTFSKEDLFNDKYLIDRDNSIEIYYAPFEYINKTARILIVGITPGWTQTEIAFETFVREYRINNDIDQALMIVKKEASFAKSMRNNLLQMLDELELSNKLGIPTFKDLFESQSHLLHSTSILKYPVFISHKNYNGNNPRLLDSTILWNSVKTEFLEEIKDFENTLIIPLGKRVDNIFQNLGIQEKLTSNRILHNFPHPSGANGHRVKQFNLYKNDLKKTVKAWN